MSSEPDIDIKVRLLVLGFSGPGEDITKILGISPTRLWRTGDAVIVGAKHVQKENGWEVCLRVDVGFTDPELPVRTVLDSFPDLGAFRRLPDGADVQLTVAMVGYRERPYLCLSKETIATLAGIGASLNFDPYDLTSSVVPGGE